MVINTNYSALNASRNLGDSQGLLNRSLARLSSGSKLINPSDDAAGFAVSTRFDAQINRTQAASDNIGNAISFSQTQDGYLKKVAKALDSAEARDKLAVVGCEPFKGTSEQLATLVKDDLVRWSRIVKESGAKVD